MIKKNSSVKFGLVSPRFSKRDGLIGFLYTCKSWLLLDLWPILESIGPLVYDGTIDCWCYIRASTEDRGRPYVRQIDQKARIFLLTNQGCLFDMAPLNSASFEWKAKWWTLAKIVKRFQQWDNFEKCFWNICFIREKLKWTDLF